MAQILNGILFIGSGVAWLMAASQLALSNKTQRNYLFAGFYFCLGVTQLAIWNVDANMQLRYPHLSETDVPLLYWAGPFLYMSYRELLTRDFKLSAIDYLHFVPGIVAFALMMDYYLKDAAFKQHHTTTLFEQEFGPGTVEILFGIGLTINAIYMAIMFRGTALLWKPETLRDEPAARVVVFLVCIATLVFGTIAAAIATASYDLIRLSVSFVSVAFFAIFIFSQRNPELFTSAQEVVESEKYKKALPSDLDLADLETRLVRLMEQEKVFNEVDLTLKGLAEKMEITGHQLSQFLNQHMKQNFNATLNKYRVAEASRLLLADLKRSAASVGFEVGFNNYTTFQLAFRKETGLSPAKYREENK